MYRHINSTAFEEPLSSPYVRTAEDKKSYKLTISIHLVVGCLPSLCVEHSKLEVDSSLVNVHMKETNNNHTVCHAFKKMWQYFQQ